MTIGVIAPSSPLPLDRLEAGLAVLEAAGYKLVLGQHVYDRHGYLAGQDAARGRDLTAMFARPDVDAVFCARGGYGASRMINHVDWPVVAANPKLFVGYSDITSLHLAFERRTGMVTIHGPVVVTHGLGMSEEAASTLWSGVGKAEPAGLLPTGSATVQTLVPGRASGRLAGGCISLLAHATGTVDAPDFAGRIVLLEDIGDPMYRVDRNLVQLLRAGLLQQAAGFVIGTVTDWEKQEKEAPVIRLEDIWRDLIIPLGKPTVVGFPFGHEPNPLTLPLGCQAELDADAGTLTILEPAVN